LDKFGPISFIISSTRDFVKLTEGEYNGPHLPAKAEEKWSNLKDKET